MRLDRGFLSQPSSLTQNHFANGNPVDVDALDIVVHYFENVALVHKDTRSNTEDVSSRANHHGVALVNEVMDFLFNEVSMFTFLA